MHSNPTMSDTLLAESTDEERSVPRAEPTPSLGNPGGVSLSLRSRTVLMLQMRGMSKAEIARQMRLTEQQVHYITRTARYVAARDAWLASLDVEFRAMKVAAFRALDRGLHSAD